MTAEPAANPYTNNSSRWGIAAAVGDGATMYRYESLDLAGQSVIYSDADFYRSDRLVVEFTG